MSKLVKTEKRIARSERSEMKGRLRSFLMFLPNLVVLLGRLLKDGRVPTAEKALFLGAIVYVVSPLDFIPDVLPFIGQIDDLYLVALTLLRLVNRTDETVVRELWPGGGDIVSLADSIAAIAPKFLPRRIARVLTSKVELAPAGKMLRGVTKRDQAIVREIVGDDHFDLEPLSARPN